MGPETRRGPGPPIHAIGNKLLGSLDGSVALDERWRRELSEAQTSLIPDRSGSFAASQGHR
jgi:hypothetical protein